MIKTSRVTLLFILVFQTMLMPVSQALAASHSRNSAERSLASFVSIAGIPGYHEVASNLSAAAVKLNEFTQKEQCARDSSHKGRCVSCLCVSIMLAPVMPFYIARDTHAENYLELNVLLPSIFITPPFRPPIV